MARRARHPVAPRRLLACVHLDRLTVNRPTRGSIEAEIASATVRFHREQQGRGPEEVRAHLIGNLVVVRLSGVFTTTEARLASTPEGRRLIRSARQELRSITRAAAEELIASIVGCAVERSYFDMAVEAAEQIEVYVLETDVERRLLRPGPEGSRAGS